MWHPDTPIEYRNEIVTGDARVLAERIPSESVDLIFTDPVYDRIEDYRWLAETAARVLRPGGNLLAYCAHINLDDVLGALSSALRFRWLFVQRKLGLQGLVFGRGVYAGYIPLVWYGTEQSMPVRWVNDVTATSPMGKAVNHLWSKNPQGLKYWLSYFSDSDSVVWEPFAGGGSILDICRVLNRNYIAFEIDPATAARARERVANTQAMHPAFLVEQEAMALG